MISPASLLQITDEIPIAGTERGNRLLTELQEGRRWQVATHSLFGGMGSFGNGAAMRVAPLGAFFADDLSLAASEAHASATVTHGHPEGEAGAVAVAVAAACACNLRSATPLEIHARLFKEVLQRTPEGEVHRGICLARDLPHTETIDYAAHVLGNGKHVLARDTVPLTLWCAVRHMTDFREALWITVAGLGDRDTNCAIVGGIVSGAVSSLPSDWLQAREPLPALT